MERTTEWQAQDMHSLTWGIHNTESQEEEVQQGDVQFRNSRRRVALHPPEEQERETRRLRIMSSSTPSSFSSSYQNETLQQGTTGVLFPSRLSTRYRNIWQSENRRTTNNPWRSTLSDMSSRRELQESTDSANSLSWLSTHDTVENEERESRSAEHLEGRRALWRRIISRTPTYSGNNRSQTASDTDPAEMDPEEYVYYPTLFRSVSSHRPMRTYRYSRDENIRHSLLRSEEQVPSSETPAVTMDAIPFESDRNTSLRSWSYGTTLDPGFRVLNETGEDLLSSDSSENSEQEVVLRPAGSRFLVRLLNRQRINGEDDEQYQGVSVPDTTSPLERWSTPSPETQRILTDTVETEDEENIDCSPRLQFLLAMDGPEDSRTHRIVVSRFGVIGLILYRKLLTCGPFYPRSPARLLVHLAGYFLFFKENSVLASRAHADQSFLGRLLALDESEAARLIDHLKTKDPIKLLMERLPPFSLLKRAIRGKRPFFHNGREALVIKFILDIYDYYFKREVPLFETYRKKVLPLLELFYTQISQNTLDNVCYQQSKVLDRMKWVMDWSTLGNNNNACDDTDFLKEEFLFLPSLESYMEHYKNISRHMLNLTESLSISSLLV